METERCILVIDEGTTSTRAILYAPDGQVRGTCQAELTQHYPEPGRVEHDALEIWEKTLSCARAMVQQAGGPDRVAGIGITNQRETLVAWDRATGVPLSRAIVWQDRRTAPRCEELRSMGLEGMVRDKTGLELDPYFSATKMTWLLQNIPEARAAGDRLAFGTIESWLVFKLTNGLHISDASNASRTMLMALDGHDWDAELLALHDVPRRALPEITDTSGRFGSTSPDLFGGPIEICGLVGDQQGATIGQGCLFPGSVKATLGTGAFILAPTGTALPRSAHRLLGTVLTQHEGKRTYALEGSIFAAGSLIKWLRDTLGILQSSHEAGPLAASVPDNAGVYILPALSGLGAPHWRPEATGIVSGLTFASGKAHIARAALEATTHQLHDLMRAYAQDGIAWNTLMIDGGMSANDWLAQDFANVLQLPVERPVDVETTARGAAMCASVGCGIHNSLEAAACMRPPVIRFEPHADFAARGDRLAAWDRLLAVRL